MTPTTIMFNVLRKLIDRWLGPAAAPNAAPPTTPQPEAAPPPPQEPGGTLEPHAAIPDHGAARSTLVAYDENLLERARTQWQFGDWDSLAQLDRDTLQHHPDRAKLALLAAAGRLQTDRIGEARQYIGLAQDWGVSKKLLARILAAGVHNSLGKAAAIAGDQPRALQHFHGAIATGSPGSEARLLVQARISQQYQQLGLPQAPVEAYSTTLGAVHIC